MSTSPAPPGVVPFGAFGGGSVGLRGAPKLVHRSAASRDSAVARRLWTDSEALTGVSVAALALYDMCKAVDKTMRIEGISVVKKVKE